MVAEPDLLHAFVLELVRIALRRWLHSALLVGVAALIVGVRADAQLRELLLLLAAQLLVVERRLRRVHARACLHERELDDVAFALALERRLELLERGRVLTALDGLDALIL